MRRTETSRWSHTAFRVGRLKTWYAMKRRVINGMQMISRRRQLFKHLIGDLKIGEDVLHVVVVL